jgi:holo-[acyl-carrier protein] synthase
MLQKLRIHRAVADSAISAAKREFILHVGHSVTSYLDTRETFATNTASAFRERQYFMFQLDRGALAAPNAPSGLRLGFDLVQVSQVAESIRRFGPAYEQRLYTPHELAYAHEGDAVCAERLAARFAAKEAVIKALDLGACGIAWREIEVCRRADGSCGVHLHGRTAVQARESGAGEILLSLSHDGDYAGAVAAALLVTHQQEVCA